MLNKPTYTRGSYEAWLTAACEAHRSGTPTAKAEADRLYTEMKFAARREHSRRVRMARQN